jgi:energy-coupling factor transport system substrate-specific component
MFASKIAMAALPNIHLLALFIASCTLTYRAKALIPLYVYVMLDGLFGGFSFWWFPYLYIWLPLWLAFMLFGKLRLPTALRAPLYMALCGLHGLSFGTLYAPAQALMFGLGFKAMLAWIIAGLPFDIIHAISGLASGALVLPLSSLLQKLEKRRHNP